MSQPPSPINPPAPGSPSPDDPLATLQARIAAELAHDFFADQPIHFIQSAASLDVMGGIAEETGSLVLRSALDRSAAVALQPRTDGNLQIFSFDLFDEHQPFTFRIPMSALLEQSIETLAREFQQPGRKWAATIAGIISIANPTQKPRGANLAIHSNIPRHAGIAASSAMTMAAAENLIAHLGLQMERPQLAKLCQRVHQQLAGESRVLSEFLGAFLKLPNGIQVMGIDSGVRSLSDQAYQRTQQLAAIGYQMILDKMRKMGESAGRTMESDPLGGYLARLDPDDYKRIFRPEIVASPDGEAITHALDHHVLEARRVRRFAEFVESAATLPADSRQRELALNKAGHLMYASHLSYSNDAMLGNAACDLLVDLVRKYESRGLYGARITARGGGGTVAVLARCGEKVDGAIADLKYEYQTRTGNVPQVFYAEENRR